MKVALVGATGFVGRHIGVALEHRGADLLRVSAPRIVATANGASEVTAAAEAWRDSHRADFEALVETFAASDAVVNAAGLATPDARETPALTGANAVAPVVLFLAANEAGSRVFVHVSSAAVQGRMPELDESDAYDIISPYARSKALGEVAVQRVSPAGRLSIYRATSVQGRDRNITQQLFRLCNLPLFPMAGDGGQPLPLALAENAGAAVAHIALSSSASGIFVHPWEGITVRRLHTLFGSGGRRVATPRAPWELLVGSLVSAGRTLPRAAAIGKRLDLLVSGQHSRGHRLASAGFAVPLGDEGYVHLAAQLRD